jgi:single-strand DNA-binding protein
MAGYNRIVMIGNLTRDPEYKQLTSGQAVCRLGLATNRSFKNRQTGAMVQEVCFVDIDVWGAQADSCRQYLQKGRSVLIEGRLKLDNWEDQNGQARSKHSIVADRVVFLSGPAGSDDEAAVEMDEKGRDAYDQLEQLKNKVQAAKPAAPRGAVRDAAPAQRAAAPARKKTESETGEIAFNDEPPFQDDLPF